MTDSGFNYELAASMLRYCPATGAFMWRTGGKGRPAGRSAGGVDRQSGYLQIGVHGKLYYGHRMAWYMTHGKLPKGVIDHINRARSDNRITNLRDVSHRENLLNTGNSRVGSSGHLGVTKARSGKWRAQSIENYRWVNLGQYDTAEEASKAFCDHRNRTKFIGDIL